MIKQLLSFLLLSFFLTIPTDGTAKAQNVWLPKPEEILLEGLYLSRHDQLIQIETSEGIVSYPYSSQTLIAWMGKHSGRLLTLQQFPSPCSVEIILDHTGTIRAMRNKPDNYAFIPGTALKGWGEMATLSPSEKYYTLFNWSDGLLLYSLAEHEPPFFLSTQPVCAWNNAGTKIAFTTPQDIGVFDINNPVDNTASFNEPTPEIVKVVTSLEWSPLDEKILYTYLEDYPDQGSGFFQIAVLGKSGKELAKKSSENLGACCWLSEEAILLILNSDGQETGKIIIWNYQTGETSFLPISFNGICRNLAYNRQEQVLAYTITNDFIDNLFIFPLSEKIFSTEKSPEITIKTFLSPLHHLQWSKDNALFFWDEINNVITKTNKTGEILSKHAGYLPEKGLASRFLYFEEEPCAEPLPIFLSPSIICINPLDHNNNDYNHNNGLIIDQAGNQS